MTPPTMQMRNLSMTNSNSSTHRTPARYEPARDGVDHINIGPSAATELGRLLAHFTESHFTHPYLGPFNCIEGYWYYVKSQTPDDRLRQLTGKAAYVYGKTLPHVRRRRFRDIIMDGNYQKILENDRLRSLLVESELPFTQYYLYGPHNLPINPKTAPWLVEDFEELRSCFKEDPDDYEIVTYEEYQEIVVPSATPRRKRV
jgi:hypothetical protein